MMEDRVQIIKERMQRILGQQDTACSTESQDSDDNSNGNMPPNQTETIHKYHLGKDASMPWFLEEWRRISIPEWQRILREARAAGNQSRAVYAAWMLADILEAEI
jgi:hypothetical protein